METDKTGVDDAYTQVAKLLSSAIADLLPPECVKRQLQGSRDLLEEIRLAPADRSLALSRLGRAERCFEHGETGVARYELRLLTRELARNRNVAERH